MSDIFSVQPPAWLQDLTRASEPGLLGKTGGLLAAGTALAFEKSEQQTDPATGLPAGGEDKRTWLESRKGFQQGMAEARMNLLDPMWRLKEQQSQVDLAHRRLLIQNDQLGIESTKREMSAWEKDAPKVADWLSSIPANPNAAPPTGLTSKAGILAIEKGVQFQTQLNIAKTRSQVNRDATRYFADSVRTLSGFDPAKAGTYSPYIGVANVPPQILDSLQADLATAKAAADKTARDAGLAPGKVVIGEHGAVTTYEASGDTPGVEPEIVTLDDGATLYKNVPQKGHYTLKKEGKPDTVWSASSLLKLWETMDRKDPRKKKIGEALGKSAEAAIDKVAPTTKEPAGTAPPAATKDPLGLFK